jgi:hypothetical protein
MILEKNHNSNNPKKPLIDINDGKNSNSFTYINFILKNIKNGRYSSNMPPISPSPCGIHLKTSFPPDCQTGSNSPSSIQTPLPIFGFFERPPSDTRRRGLPPPLSGNGMRLFRVESLTMRLVFGGLGK